MRDGEMGSVTWLRRQSSRVFIVACLASASCSVLIDKDRVQCKVDADCRDRGAEFAGAVCQSSICQPDPVWGCLGSVVFPRPQAGGTFTVTIHLRDLIDGSAIPGVTGRVCEKLDTECKNPLTAELPATPAGDLVFMLRSGFDGYVEMKAPGKMPGLYFIYPPVDADREIPQVPLIEPALVEQLAVLNGRQLQADRGHVLLGGYDCQHVPADGMTLSTDDADGQTSNFYVINNVPKAGAKTTDLSGRGGFINLKTGIVVVTARVGADNRKIAAVSLFVRAGMITYTSIVPSPQ
jgi:hypothetical protein